MAITLDTPLPRGLPALESSSSAGPLTWVVTALAGCGLLAVAVVTTSGTMFVAAAVAIAFLIAFAVRPVWGLAGVLAARPTLDLWANTSIVAVPGHSHVNAGSVMALLMIGVGGAHLLENLGTFRRAPCAWPFLAFTALATLSVAAGHTRSVGLQEVLRLVAIIVIYGVAFVSMRSRTDVVVLAAAVLASAVVPAVVALHQSVVVGIEAGRRGFARAHGTFVTVDGLGIFMALIITFATPMALARSVRWRWLLWIATPLAVAALVASYGRTGWAASLFGLVLIAGTRYRWLLAILPIALVAVAVAVPTTTSRVSDLSQGQTKYGPGNTFNGRVQMWKAALPQVRHRPLTGAGFGSIPTIAKRQVANDYVRALVETGVFGLAVYVWLLFAALAAAWRAMMLARASADRLTEAVMLGVFAAVPAYMLMSGDSNLMTQVVIAGMFWTMVAIGHAYVYCDWDGLRP